MSDYQLNSRTERYLDENQGKLNHFYSHIGGGSSYKFAFACALAKPDVVRLRMAGKYNGLIDTPNANGALEVDPDEVLEAIEYLEETKHEYPEGHPIWQTR